MDYPIRVLQAVVNMNRGGAETLIMNLYRNIDRSQIQFDFLTCKEGVYEEEILQLGGSVHRVPYITEAGHFGYLRALERFFSLHREYRIIHSHMDQMSGLVLREAKKAGIPVRIAHSHSTKSEGAVAARLYKWFAGQFILPNATELMACSSSASKWLFSDNSRRALVLKNAIDLRKFTFSGRVRKEIRDELRISDNTLVLGHIGRFCQPKNHSFLIDIFKELSRVNSNAVLLLAGDGPLRPKIEEKTAGLNLSDRVKFLGIRSDINRLIQAFDIFVFPSLYEGLPVTLIEAQGAGIPCLISDNITREVDMEIGLIDYLPLKDKMLWVRKITDSPVRSSAAVKTKALQDRGYDIQNASAWLKDYYLKLSG